MAANVAETFPRQEEKTDGAFLLGNGGWAWEHRPSSHGSDHIWGPHDRSRTGACSPGSVRTCHLTLRSMRRAEVRRPECCRGSMGCWSTAWRGSEDLMLAVEFGETRPAKPLTNLGPVWRAAAERWRPVPEGYMPVLIGRLIAHEELDRGGFAHAVVGVIAPAMHVKEPGFAKELALSIIADPARVDAGPPPRRGRRRRSRRGCTAPRPSDPAGLAIPGDVAGPVPVGRSDVPPSRR